MNHVQPSDANQSDDAALAANVIRQKLTQLYDEEPDAATELTEAEHVNRRSRHQQFMHELNNSGKDLATIQTEWHSYYQSLPDHEKHEVWHEFYSNQSAATGVSDPAPAEPALQKVAQHKEQAATTQPAKAAATEKAKKLRDARSVSDIGDNIRDKVTAGGKLQAKHHLQSLAFGLGAGVLVLFIFLFSFFNEVIIAPFIQPSRAEASTPLIVNSNTVAATDKPEVIIPKINVEIPVDYTQTTTDENIIENSLEKGVVHYPTTAKPGQNGNAAIFGHSSNNIFNKGQYKFAFVLLHTLVKGDKFYLTNDGKVYVYEVFDMKVVDPSEVGVLNAVQGQTATATLITCDPPGTSLHRLVVVGKQISPDPAGNAAATTPDANLTSNPGNALPGNGPTLWGKLTGNIIGKLVVIAVIVGGLWFIVRSIKRWYDSRL